jgi:glutamate dehydrogenase (NADP+)
MNSKEYVNGLIETVKKRNPGEPEFHQTIKEVLESIVPVLDAHPEYIKTGLVERLVEPERQIVFRVAWVDDNAIPHVNRGFRVQFSSAIGPYKGGLRFHPSVNFSIMKFLGFEQILKNSLTGLSIGGAKGGSDFDPRGKSDAEVMRFCQSFMTELYRHIGPDVDVPAGDIGVGGREIGYLYGQYKRLKGAFENGVLTGKGISFGGSLVRPEATGYGAAYFCEQMLKTAGTDFKGKTVAISGFGNVSWGLCKKVAELGGKVVTLSGPDGYIYDPKGVTLGDKIDYLLEMRSSGHDKVKDYADKFGCEFFAGQKPWNTKVDIVMPSATQNDIHLDHAKQIVANNIKFVCEVANMPCTNEAVEFMQANGVIVGPSKAANAGGVATSALEMAQNSARLSWSAEDVNTKLHNIMIDIYNNSAAAAKRYGQEGNLVMGANIAGFERVADAMFSQGIV